MSFRTGVARCGFHVAGDAPRKGNVLYSSTVCGRNVRKEATRLHRRDLDNYLEREQKETNVWALSSSPGTWRQSVSPVSEVLRVLFVEDSKPDADLIVRLLKASGFNVHFELVEEAEPMRQALAGARWDVIIADCQLPQFSAAEALRIRNERAREIPLIVVSGVIAEESAVELMRAGAQDYVSKNRIARLIPAVRRETQEAQARRALEKHNEDLELAMAERTLEVFRLNQRLLVLDRSKNEFLGMISHELRTPLNGLLGAGELVLEDLTPTADNVMLRDLYARSRRRLLSILDDALLLAEIDVSGISFKTTPVLLSEALSRAMANTAEFAKTQDVTITAPPSTEGLVIAEGELLVRALRSLLETAIKFSAKGGSVFLSFDLTGNFRRVIIESHGLMIPVPALPKFFEIFAIGEAITVNGGDLGLAAPLAHRILSLFGGFASVANRDYPPGIQLTVSLRNGAPNDGDRL